MGIIKKYFSNQNHSKINSSFKEHRHKKRRGRFIKRLVLVFLLIIFFILFFVFLFSRPIFNIKNVIASGDDLEFSQLLEKETNKILNQKVLRFFSKKNIFLFSSQFIKELLDKQFPQLNPIEVKKDILNRLILISFQKRTPIGIWCQAESKKTENKEADKGEEAIEAHQIIEIIKETKDICFYFDKNGIIFDEAPKTSGSLILFVLEDLKNKDIDKGQKKLEPEMIESFFKVKELVFQESNINIWQFEIVHLKSAPYIKAFTKEGFEIYLDISFNPELISKNFKNILTLEIKDEVKKLEYIDLRLLNKVFYKLK